MQSLNCKRNRLRSFTGLLACVIAVGLHTGTSADEGVVRISDRGRSTRPAQYPVRQTSLTYAASAAGCPNCTAGCPQCMGQPAPYVVHQGPAREVSDNPVKDLWQTAAMKWEAHKTKQRLQKQAEQAYCPECRKQIRSKPFFGIDKHAPCSCLAWGVKKMCDQDVACKRCLLGKIAPDGCCGQGCPMFGHYYLLYSANPYYFDQRDGMVYGAQGYGTPMAVPLAPNVSSTYNYGHGIPSSRLTPISTRAPW